METFEAIHARRAIKHYDPDFVMPEEDEKKLFEAAIQSPTSFNMQNWRFVVVKDKEKRQKIREAAWDQTQVTDASLLIILCADLKAHAKDPQRYWTEAPKEVQDILVPMIEPFYAEKGQLQRDEGNRSCGLAGQTIMLAAKAMGYDSCPMIGFDPVKVGEVINLPEDHMISFIIVVGKAAKQAWPKPGQLPLDKVVITDGF